MRLKGQLSFLRLKFKHRLIISNVAIAVIILGLICLALVQGIYRSAINSAQEDLSRLASDIRSFIVSEYKNSKTSESAGDFLEGTASKLISQFVTLNPIVLLYGEDGAYLTSTQPTSVDGINPGYAKSSILWPSYGTPTNGRVVTKNGNSKYLMVFVPLTEKGKPGAFGAIELYLPLRDADKMVSQVLMIFAMMGAFLAVAAGFIYNLSYEAMFRPLRQLAGFMYNLNTSGLLAKPGIPYSADDEIKALIDGVGVMIDKANSHMEDLQLEREKLLALISSMQDAVVAVNMSGENTTKTNEKFSEYFPGEDAYFAVFPYIDDAIKRSQEKKEVVALEFEYNERHFLATATPIYTAESNGVIAIIKDITSVKNMEEAQKKFISSISHELRSPLTTIKGYIDLLRRRGTDDAEVTEKALTTTMSEVDRLLRLVNELLNIDGISDMEFEFIFTTINPDELISEVVSQMNMRSEETGVTIQYSHMELPDLNGDRDRLKQVLINVLDNAVKYSDPGNAVRVIANYDETSLEITVRDYGLGIPEDKRERVFDTFYRVEEDRSRLRGGYGIGLSLVKNIVERHKGSVTLESIEDQGTLVTILLPLPVKKEEIESSSGGTETGGENAS